MGLNIFSILGLALAFSYTFGHSLYINPLNKQNIMNLIPEAARSSVEFIGLSDNKLYFRDVTNTSKSFGDSADFCHKNGLQTAMIESAQENNVIVDYFKESNYQKDFWLGAWDIDHEGLFTRVGTGKPLNYTNWRSGYPRENLEKNCLYISVRTKDWLDIECWTTFLVVPLCQFVLP